jgi:hypothetical protein
VIVATLALAGSSEMFRNGDVGHAPANQSTLLLSTMEKAMRIHAIAALGALALVVASTGSSSAGILWDDSYPRQCCYGYWAPWAGTGYFGRRWYGRYRHGHWVRHRRHIHPR